MSDSSRICTWLNREAERKSYEVFRNQTAEQLELRKNVSRVQLGIAAVFMVLGLLMGVLLVSASPASVGGYVLQVIKLIVMLAMWTFAVCSLLAAVETMQKDPDVETPDDVQEYIYKEVLLNYIMSGEKFRVNDMYDDYGNNLGDAEQIGVIADMDGEAITIFFNVENEDGEKDVGWLMLGIWDLNMSISPDQAAYILESAETTA